MPITLNPGLPSEPTRYVPSGAPTPAAIWAAIEQQQSNAGHRFTQEEWARAYVKASDGTVSLDDAWRVTSILWAKMQKTKVGATLADFQAAADMVASLPGDVQVIPSLPPGAILLPDGTIYQPTIEQQRVTHEIEQQRAELEERRRASQAEEKRLRDLATQEDEARRQGRLLDADRIKVDRERIAADVAARQADITLRTAELEHKKTQFAAQHGVEVAQLTGVYNGQETLDARRLAEQARQFNVGQYNTTALALLDQAGRLRGPENYFQYQQQLAGGRSLMDTLTGQNAGAVPGAVAGQGGAPASVGGILQGLGVNQLPGQQQANVVPTQQMGGADARIGYVPGQGSLAGAPAAAGQQGKPSPTPGSVTILPDPGQGNAPAAGGSTGQPMPGQQPGGSAGEVFIAPAGQTAGGYVPGQQQANVVPTQQMGGADAAGGYVPGQQQANVVPTQQMGGADAAGGYVPGQQQAVKPSTPRGGMRAQPYSESVAGQPAVGSAGQGFIAPRPHQIDPAAWDRLSDTGKKLVLSAAAAGRTQGGAYTEQDFVDQLNATRPKGTAARQTSYDFRTPAGVY